MKLKILTYIFVLILLVGTVSAYTCSGIVTGIDVGPLEGVTVEIYDTQICGGSIATDTTNTNGIFDFNLVDIGSGLRTIKINHSPYDPFEKTYFISVNFDVPPEDTILGPAPPVTLTGKVTNLIGENLPNTEITVKRSGSTIITVYTIADGTYTVNDLENQAAYDITASLALYNSLTKPITMNGPTTLDFSLVPAEVTCTDNDLDGFYIEGGDCGPIDCDDNDRNVYPDAPEICDGKDNQCPGDADYGFIDVGCNCINGQQKLCGTNLGVCQYGIQTCTNGRWGSCIGSINPVEEICGDNLDNDCDGLVEENCYPAFDYSLQLTKDTSAEVTLAINEAVQLKFSDKTHYATLKALSPYYITINIQSDPVTLSIKQSDPTNIDLDNDGKDDIFITYNGIESNKANIEFGIPTTKTTTSSTSSKRTSSLPETSVIDYFKEIIPTKAKIFQTFRLQEAKDNQVTLAAAFLLFLLMLSVIMNFTKRKWRKL